MDEIFADYRGGGRFDLHIRDHKVTVDQPVSDGGADAGPTPTELFVASLAGCVGYYASRFLQRHMLPTAGLAVRATFEMSTGRPHRVSAIDIRVHPPAHVPAERLPALYAVVSNCTVHNSIERAPSIDIGLAEPLAETWVGA